MEEDKKENILEIGTYKILGPDSGDISIDKIKFKNSDDKERIWKVKSLTEKEVILEIIKF